MAAGVLHLRSGSEEEDHAAKSKSVFPQFFKHNRPKPSRTRNLHKRVREAHLGAVDSTITRRLEQRQEIMVARVDNNLLEHGLRQQPFSSIRSFVCIIFCAVVLYRTVAIAALAEHDVVGCTGRLPRFANQKLCRGPTTTYLEFLNYRRHDARSCNLCLFRGNRGVERRGFGGWSRVRFAGRLRPRQACF